MERRRLGEEGGKELKHGSGKVERREEGVGGSGGGYIVDKDTYLTEMTIQDNSVATGITLSTDSSFPKMETKICKGVKAVFGGELKSCTLDTLQLGRFVVEGRLRFHRDKLQAAATDAGSDASHKYIEGRLTYACSTELICEGIDVTPLRRRESFPLTGNFSTATPKVGMRNDSNHYAAQKSVCDTIKNQLGSLYVNCYVRVFETGGGTTTISVEVDTNGLLDEVKKDATAMKTLAFSRFLHVSCAGRSP
ncbi:hypothetical protein LSAT2_024611 [Lamellibrachia satsuma]|nr:hypothetical protein LSAT2_024611 [Lamellibrachia satsuma]